MMFNGDPGRQAPWFKHPPGENVEKHLVSLYEYRLIGMALVYLVLTGLLGVFFFLFPSLTPYFRVTHIHVGVLNFFLSVVMGLAYWMMPRPGGLRQERLEGATFYLLNDGLVLRAVAEPWWRYTGDGLPRGLSVVSGFLLFTAILSFVYAMQARIKTADMVRALREVRGKRAGRSQ